MVISSSKSRNGTSGVWPSAHTLGWGCTCLRMSELTAWSVQPTAWVLHEQWAPISPADWDRIWMEPLLSPSLMNSAAGERRGKQWQQYELPGLQSHEKVWHLARSHTESSCMTAQGTEVQLCCCTLLDPPQWFLWDLAVLSVYYFRPYFTLILTSDRASAFDFQDTF